MSSQPMKGCAFVKFWFRKNPDYEIMNKVLKCFDINDINQYKIISKYHSNVDQICKNFTELIPDLSLYFHIRIINNNFYEKEISFNKCISMLRNIIFHLDYIILRTETIVKKKKIIEYRIVNKTKYYEDTNRSIKINNRNRTVSFD